MVRGVCEASLAERGGAADHAAVPPAAQGQRAAAGAAHAVVHRLRARRAAPRRCTARCGALALSHLLCRQRRGEGELAPRCAAPRARQWRVGRGAGRGFGGGGGGVSPVVLRPHLQAAAVDRLAAAIGVAAPVEPATALVGEALHADRAVVAAADRAAGACCGAGCGAGRRGRSAGRPGGRRAAPHSASRCTSHDHFIELSIGESTADEERAGRWHAENLQQHEQHVLARALRTSTAAAVHADDDTVAGGLLRRANCERERTVVLEDVEAAGGGRGEEVPRIAHASLGDACACPVSVTCALGPRREVLLGWVITPTRPFRRRRPLC